MGKNDRNSNRPATDCTSYGTDASGGLPLELHRDSSGYQLADWTGGFAPAPVDWESRPTFAKSKATVQDCIEIWKAGIDVEFREIGIGACYRLAMSQHDAESWVAQNCEKARPFEYDIANCRGENCKQGEVPYARSTLKGEIAHKSWVPDTICEKPADEWWADHLREPAMDASSLPFWKCFASSHTLQGLAVPDAEVDASENNMAIVRQQTAKHSMKTVNISKMRSSAFKNNRKDKAYLRDLSNSYLHLNNPNAPRVNCFFRPAERRDMAQITSIYNNYVEKSIFCPEGQSLGTRQMTGRYEDIVEAKLPFLVAVDRSSKGTRRNGPETGFSEHILGFAMADDYNDRSGMYRYTVELESYVDRNVLRQGIGRCLLDKLLVVLDQYWVTRGGYDFVGDSITYGSGGIRVVGAMVIHIPYDSNDRTRLDWMQRWLSDFGFKKAGELEEIGHKMSTVVNQAIFMKKTGSKVEPWAP